MLIQEASKENAFKRTNSHEKSTTRKDDAYVIGSLVMSRNSGVLDRAMKPSLYGISPIFGTKLLRN